MRQLLSSLKLKVSKALYENLHFHVPKLLSFLLCIAPSTFPTDITTRRSSDGTSIVIVWRKVSLKEAHGFFECIIVLDAVNSRRRQSSDITVHVPFNKTSINVTSLNPQLTYALTMRIAVYNERGEIIEGPNSIPIRILSHCKLHQSLIY